MNSDTPTQPAETRTAALAERRLRAVEMRLEGAKLSAISLAVGLSQPTIIKAHKAFLDGGWDAVNVRKQGRATGTTTLGANEPALRKALFATLPEDVSPQQRLWTATLVQQWLEADHQITVTRKTVNRYIRNWGIAAASASRANGRENPPADKKNAGKTKPGNLPRYRLVVKAQQANVLLVASDNRGQLLWLIDQGSLSTDLLLDFFSRLHHHCERAFAIEVSGIDTTALPQLTQWFEQHGCQLTGATSNTIIAADGKQQNNSATTATASATNQFSSTNHGKTMKTEKSQTDEQADQLQSPVAPKGKMVGNFNTTAKASNEQHSDGSASVAASELSHLEQLEAESIHIIREVMAVAENPAMLYSIGKDSAVMLHLARKAFYPAPPPFPLLHVDTTWKFRAMYEFRDQIAKEYGFELLVHSNETGISQGVNPFTHGSELHTSIMKTEGLKQALEKYGFDATFGGARRDEEKSRAKERVFSFRNAQHRWDPKNQRPELWKLYNSRKQKGESIRVFPLSNWTELDVWQYIHQENIPVVPLYLAAERPVVERDGMLIMVDDDRLPMNPGEVPMMRTVRFRTLGCYPLTGAIESSAATIPEIVEEMLVSRSSERSGRMIDHDSAASMEKKKQEGYF